MIISPDSHGQARCLFACLGASSVEVSDSSCLRPKTYKSVSDAELIGSTLDSKTQLVTMDSAVDVSELSQLMSLAGQRLMGRRHLQQLREDMRDSGYYHDVGCDMFRCKIRAMTIQRVNHHASRTATSVRRQCQ